MHLQALEVLAPGDVGNPRPVQLAHGAHERIDPHRARRAAGVALQLHLPHRILFIEARRGDFRVVADVGLKPVPLDEVPEVVQQLVAPREVLAPGVGLERVRVEMVGDVDAAARVLILVPGAADGVVLLDQGEGNARFLQAQRLQQPRHARADHQHVELLAHRRRHLPRPARRARVIAVQGELLEHHRHVFVADALTDHEIHHLLDERRRGLRRQRAAPVAVGLERLERGLAYARLVLLAQAPLKAAHHHDLRADLALQQARVAGDVDERHHERRDARAFELLRDEFIAFSDRLLGGQQVLTHRAYSRS